MTLKEALAQAKRTGGNPNWSKEKGWFVSEGRYTGKPFWGQFRAPWETAPGEGFIAPWTVRAQTPQGWAAWQYPKLGWTGQQQLESLYGAEEWRAQVPEWLKLAEVTPEELTSYYDELYNTIVAPKGISKELWKPMGDQLTQHN